MGQQPQRALLSAFRRFDESKGIKSDLYNSPPLPDRSPETTLWLLYICRRKTPIAPQSPFYHAAHRRHID
jgi:hypothetical protein